jgi:hypothetical protein
MPLGMDLGDLTLEVKALAGKGQADELGVGVGWRVAAVNGVAVATFDDFLDAVTLAKAWLQGPRVNAKAATVAVSFFMPASPPPAAAEDASDGVWGARRRRRGDPNDANMEGYLLKKGDNVLNPWQSRWFAARGHYLKYYKNLGAAHDPKNIMAAIDLLLVDVQSAKGRTFHLKLKGVPDIKWYGTYHGIRPASTCCWLHMPLCSLHSVEHMIGVC